MKENCEKFFIEPGTKAWLDIRKTKITATDAAIIMGVNPWKSRLQLYTEKISSEHSSFMNKAMKRGLELEPIARLQYTLITGIHVEPKVFIKEWQMASVDGISDDGEALVEIKCPGKSAHATALSGKVPDYYYPQLQHQMHVCGLNNMDYFSFDGEKGIILPVVRDDDFIKKMNELEFEFYKCLKNKIPPEELNDDIFMQSDEWLEYATRYRTVKRCLNELKEEEECLKEMLVSLCNDVNCRGSGISLKKMRVKGQIDYSLIPELKGIDIEGYRKPDSIRWRVSV